MSTSQTRFTLDSTRSRATKTREQIEFCQDRRTTHTPSHRWRARKPRRRFLLRRATQRATRRATRRTTRRATTILDRAVAAHVYALATVEADTEGLEFLLVVHRKRPMRAAIKTARLDVQRSRARNFGRGSPGHSRGTAVLSRGLVVPLQPRETRGPRVRSEPRHRDWTRLKRWARQSG